LRLCLHVTLSRVQWKQTRVHPLVRTLGATTESHRRTGHRTPPEEIEEGETSNMIVVTCRGCGGSGRHGDPWPVPCWRWRAGLSTVNTRQVSVPRQWRYGPNSRRARPSTCYSEASTSRSRFLSGHSAVCLECLYTAKSGAAALLGTYRLAISLKYCY
jgi:hypothetical protein